MNKVDKIFKSGLDNFQVRPPEITWDQIESQLAEGKKDRFPILKMAASISILVVLSVIVYYLQKPETVLQSSQGIVHNDSPSTANEQESTTSPLIEETSSQENSKSTNQIAGNNTVTRTHYKNTPRLKPIHENNSMNSLPDTKILPVKIETIAMEIPDDMTEEPLPPVTISYKSGDKKFDSNATSEGEKESTLKKAWEYALSVKNGEERPFNIKEMKNELFAFDFNKKKKSKTQN